MTTKEKLIDRLTLGKQSRHRLGRRRVCVNAYHWEADQGRVHHREGHQEPVDRADRPRAECVAAGAAGAAGARGGWRDRGGGGAAVSHQDSTAPGQLHDCIIDYRQVPGGQEGRRRRVRRHRRRRLQLDHLREPKSPRRPPSRVGRRDDGWGGLPWPTRQWHQFDRLCNLREGLETPIDQSEQTAGLNPDHGTWPRHLACLGAANVLRHNGGGL